MKEYFERIPVEYGLPEKPGDYITNAGTATYYGSEIKWGFRVGLKPITWWQPNEPITGHVLTPQELEVRLKEAFEAAFNTAMCLPIPCTISEIEEYFATWLKKGKQAEFFDLEKQYEGDLT